MRNLILYTFCLFSMLSLAQNIEIGQVKTLQSTILNEARDYWVYLPENYNNTNFKNQEYPVIYLLDGEKYFHVTSGMVKNLSNGYYPLIPECIVVAIKNTNRSRDLTPTTVDSLSYQNGGADIFETFITDELIPEINKNYNTLDYKILIGHSFGGLFAINSFLKETPQFNAYIAIDPSLWWDNEVLVKKLKNSIPTTDFKRRTLFFANANSIGNQKTPSKQHEAHFTAKKNMIEILEASIAKNLNLNTKYYKDEDHGSVVLPSLIDGLRSVFKGYRINVKELIKNPSLLEQHYQDISKKLGFTIKPQGPYLDRVVELALKRGENENAIILNNINKKTNPDNVHLKNKFK
ncbi:alpha/beta hydrolase [Psychroserpens sp. NJDZ02]|uniref:alpha/beta hydrolase n=1 Tax=Psychroserpens sp. NJDZ02 TaxID=2570561 RepID=UPI0010A83396|nr:alpha/beta hydrolase-fold protein [Psychroserpens sp. NJDZ02]QCE41841.1 alpha/beta hydrolase [Psychroserpens sp. NJDZ02]